MRESKKALGCQETLRVVFVQRMLLRRQRRRSHAAADNDNKLEVLMEAIHSQLKVTKSGPDKAKRGEEKPSKELFVCKMNFSLNFFLSR